MGLAASQVRLLMLTSRKIDIEGSLMSISNQKLSLARESTKISRDYSNALNAKTLFWSDMSGNALNFTYDLLMSPNNSVTGQFVYTSSSGDVVLNDTLANFFGGTGVNSGDNAGSKTKIEFLQAMMGCDETLAKKYIEGYSINTATGANYAMSRNDFLKILKGVASPAGNTPSSAMQVGNHATWAEEYDANNTFVLNGENGTWLIPDYNQTQLNCVQSSLEAMIIQLRDGLISKGGFNVDALNDAKTKTFDRFKDITSIGECENLKDSLVTESRKDNAVVVGHGNYPDANNNTYACAVSIKSIVDSFFTNYMIALGYEEDAGGEYNVAKKVSDSHYATTDPSSITNTNAQPEQAKANFYINQYDAINTKGWLRDSNITNSDYLQNLIAGGYIWVEQIDKEGEWSPISTDGADSPLMIESDETAISKAEAVYDEKKAEIDYKEQRLDLNMKNLDTERAAVDTELDSVKKIIDKNIERSFKMFQA